MTPARLPRLLRRLIPDLGEIGVAERVRASIGAMLGLAMTGIVSRMALGPAGDLPLLIAPMGASAVLLFAVPSSPLAQPWSILGGNVVAALIGVTAARFIADPIAASAVGGGLAIAAMMMLRCLHPPSGAVALTAVLGGPAVHAAGYGFALWPVGLNSALLLAAALAFNNATGRRYPHVPDDRKPSATSDAAVSAVLRRHGEVVDIGQEDLARLVAEIETEMSAPGDRRCGDVMRREADMLAAATPLVEALDRMVELRRTSLPAIDERGRYLGVVLQADLVRQTRTTRTATDTTPKAPHARDAASGPLPICDVAAARPDMSIGEGLALVVAQDADVPVIDAAGRVVGRLTQSDLLRRSIRASAGFGSRREDAQPRSAIQRL